MNTEITNPTNLVSDFGTIIYHNSVHFIGDGFAYDGGNHSWSLVVSNCRATLYLKGDEQASWSCVSNNTALYGLAFNYKQDALASEWAVDLLNHAIAEQRRHRSRR